jgi:hypothetical protein
MHRLEEEAYCAIVMANLSKLFYIGQKWPHVKKDKGKCAFAIKSNHYHYLPLYILLRSSISQCLIKEEKQHIH